MSISAAEADVNANNGRANCLNVDQHAQLSLQILRVIAPPTYQESGTYPT
jgi:hypothetical protein